MNHSKCISKSAIGIIVFAGGLGLAGTYMVRVTSISILRISDCIFQKSQHFGMPLDLVGPTLELFF
jgi:hypothetical protein